MKALRRGKQQDRLENVADTADLSQALWQALLQQQGPREGESLPNLG